MKKSPTLKNQAKALFIGNILATVIAFFISIILTRLITPAEMGIYRQFTIMAGPIIAILGFGYTTSLYYFYPIKDEKGREMIIQQTQFLLLINSSLALLIVILFGNWIFEYYEFPPIYGLKALLIVFISLQLLTTMLTDIFTLEKNVIKNKTYFPIEKVIKFIIVIGITLLIPGYMGPIIGIVVFAGFRFLYLCNHIKKYFLKIYRIDFKLLSSQMRYSIPFALAVILDVISGYFDKIFIIPFVSDAEYGVYIQAFINIPILTMIFDSIHNVIVPEISVLISENKMKEARVMWQKAVEKTSSVAIPFVCLFWLLAYELIIAMYTEAYIAAAEYYRIYIFVFIVSMFSHNIIIRAANKTKFIFIASVIGTIITIAIGIYIIPKYGLVGAVFTALLAEIIPMIISLFYEKKIMNLTFANWMNWSRIGLNTLICLSITIPLYYLKDYIPNLYLRGLITGIVFTIWVVSFQMKYDLFLFNLEPTILKVKSFLGINNNEK